MGWMIGMMAGVVLVLLVFVGFRRNKSSGSERNVIHLKTKESLNGIRNYIPYSE
jgi:hypothetical protein